jgi:preprotein translocase subunit SecG
MLYQVIIVIHILLGLGIIGLVLMQQGKGADAGAAFGSGASGSVFGAQGSASFLSRTTAVFATLFFISSLGLAVYGGFHTKKADLIDTISAEPAAALDVPLSQPKPASDDVPAAAKAPQATLPVEPVPAAPVIKEVPPAQ